MNKRSFPSSTRIAVVGFLVLVAALSATTSTEAHPDARELIARYTAEIDAGSRDPKVYYDRSVAWRSVNRNHEAAADLKKALELNPEFLMALQQLPRVLAAQGQVDEAIDTAKKAIEVARAHGRAAEAHCWGVLARVELARKGHASARAALAKAFELQPAGDLDWFLAEADALQALGKSNEAIKALKKAHDRTGSVVLRNAWLDTLLDAGRGVEALPLIEAELKARPRNSAWLVRRARARLSTKNVADAEADLRLAVEELDRKISADHPHVALLIDRAMAWALLGEKERAAKDIAVARDHGASAELLAPAARLLSAPSTPAASEAL